MEIEKISALSLGIVVCLMLAGPRKEILVVLKADRLFQ